MPIKIKYPAKPCCYQLTVLDMLTLLQDLPPHTPIEFRNSPLETETYKVVKMYKKHVTPLLGDDTPIEETSVITFVLL